MALRSVAGANPWMSSPHSAMTRPSLKDTPSLSAGSCSGPAQVALGSSRAGSPQTEPPLSGVSVKQINPAAARGPSRCSGRTRRSWQPDCLTRPWESSTQKSGECSVCGQMKRHNMAAAACKDEVHDEWLAVSIADEEISKSTCALYSALYGWISQRHVWHMCVFE